MTADRQTLLDPGNQLDHKLALVKEATELIERAYLMGHDAGVNDVCEKILTAITEEGVFVPSVLEGATQDGWIHDFLEMAVAPPLWEGIDQDGWIHDFLEMAVVSPVEKKVAQVVAI